MRAYPVETVELESEALGYVNNGNLTDDGTNLYEWDELNRLVRVLDRSSNDELAEYSYDAMNRRIVKHLDTNTDGYVNSSDDRLGMYHCGVNVCEERGGNDGSGSVVRSYVHGMNYVDEMIAFSTDSTSIQHIYLCDLRYSVYAFVDTAGNVKERYVYDAYGKRTVMDASFAVRSSATVDQRFAYTGRELDDESGLMFFRARYYSPEQGRFIGRDPIGFKDGLNLYAGWYIPNHVDPEGNSKDCPKWNSYAQGMVMEGEIFFEASFGLNWSGIKYAQGCANYRVFVRGSICCECDNDTPVDISYAPIKICVSMPSVPWSIFIPIPGKALAVTVKVGYNLAWFLQNTAETLSKASDILKANNAIYQSLNNNAIASKVCNGEDIKDMLIDSVIRFGEM